MSLGCVCITDVHKKVESALWIFRAYEKGSSGDNSIDNGNLAWLDLLGAPPADR